MSFRIQAPAMDRTAIAIDNMLKRRWVQALLFIATLAIVWTLGTKTACS